MGLEGRKARNKGGSIPALSEALVQGGDQSILGEEDYLRDQVMVGNVDSQGQSSSKNREIWKDFLEEASWD